MRPYLVPLLPTFHGMENENPYTHIWDFEEVCATFKEGAFDMDLFQSMKKWDSAVGIVAARANGTVAAGERTVNFAMHCENFIGIAKISQS